MLIMHVIFLPPMHENLVAMVMEIVKLLRKHMPYGSKDYKFSLRLFILLSFCPLKSEITQKLFKLD